MDYIFLGFNHDNSFNQDKALSAFDSLEIPCMQSHPILHRSLKSPYAQKVMLAIGYLNQPYLSFIAPKGIPRPVEEILVGNYSRRIPILQIGADLYCDSELIVSTLATQANMSSLLEYPSDEEAQQWIKKIEMKGAYVMFGALKPLELIVGYFKNMPPNHAWKFITDRMKLAKKLEGVKSALPHDKKVQQARSYLEALDQQLSKHDFLLTDNAPTSVDFTAFTMVYYHHIINGLKHAKGLNHLLSWFSRMEAIGTGQMQEISGQETLDIARNAEPAPIDEALRLSPRIGQKVAYRNKGFMPEMNEAVEGVIVGEDDHKIILRRENPQVGTVHVHFPKLDY